MARKNNLKLVPKTLEGKICLLTGFTSGIGKAAALDLASRGATMILPARNPVAAEMIRSQIEEKTLNKNLFVLKVDLSSLKEIATVCREIKKRFKKIDILINNAGVMSGERKLSKDNIELTFAVNHLAYFMLTNQLLDLLKKSKSARIINVSSDVHRIGKMDFGNLMFETGYKRIRVYAESKLANILFTLFLAKRLENTKISVNCLHPGAVATSLGRDFSTFSRIVWNLIAKSPKKGAGTIIFLASSDDVEGVTGKYFANKKERTPSQIARDPAVQKKLWELSEEMCKAYIR